MNRIVIGTANFNQKYGLTKSSVKKISSDKKLLNYINKNVQYIDTADSYKLSKNIIKKLRFKEKKIITKYKLPYKKTSLFVKNFKKKVTKDLNAFGVKKLEAVLFHNVNDLNNYQGMKLLQILKSLKNEKKIKKIGVSIYTLKDADMALKIFTPDIIQLPLNLFNQEFIESKYIDLFKKKKITVQVRSIFLQGLLLKNLNDLKKINLNKKLFKNIKKFNDWCINKKVTRLQACIHFIKNLKIADLITIGFENEENLKEIKAVMKKNLKIKFLKLNINEKILDPRKW